MKKYLSFFRLRFIMGLQYRTAAAAGIVTQFFWGAMEILAFRAFYEADAAAFPMPFEAVVTYVWLQQAFLAMFAAWGMEGEIFDVIRNGNIAYELCRPVGIYQMWFARSAANRVSRALLRCVPILTVASLLPAPYGPWSSFSVDAAAGAVGYGGLYHVGIYYHFLYPFPGGGSDFLRVGGGIFCRGRDSAALFSRKSTICSGTAALCSHAECAAACLQRQYDGTGNAAGGLSAGVLAGGVDGSGMESLQESGKKSDSAGRVV